MERHRPASTREGRLWRQEIEVVVIDGGAAAHK